MTLDVAKAKTIDLLTCKPQNLASGLEPMGAAAAGRRFSVFIGSDLEKAVALTERWMQMTAQRGDAALDDVVADAEQEMHTLDSDLVKHALLMFITHDAVGRQLPIPPLVEREPEAVVPSSRALNLPPAGIETLGGTGAEAALDYFREDTAFNEHHTKWHTVYPSHPPNGKMRNRQGELFWYMHQQMLARYDAERSSVGMQPVVPLDDFTALIVEGYDPEIPGGWAPRPDDSSWPRLPIGGQFYGPDEHARRRDNLLAAARSGKLRHPTKGDIAITGAEMFASTLESNLNSVEGSSSSAFSHYGSYHNLGHGLLSAAGLPGSGVMASTTTAVRDPVFYRWHRHVDDIMDEWWRTRPAHDLAKSDPGVRAHEIAVIAATAVGGADPQQWGEANFGGGAWGQHPTGVARDQLRTMMGSQQVPTAGGLVSKPHLDHDDFYWLLRCENPTAKDVEVTFRIFLAVDALADRDRRAWIEMDKFTDKVAAGARYVKLRSARDAAVVRKPALRPGDPVPPLAPGADPNYCDCGWPYHLLVPRGSTAGMSFRILVLLTDWATDQVRDEKKHKCGSLSFCGARDIDYPDKQEMGYPFNRPIDLAALAQRPNVATRTISIIHTP